MKPVAFVIATFLAVASGQQGDQPKAPEQVGQGPRKCETECQNTYGGKDQEVETDREKGPGRLSCQRRKATSSVSAESQTRFCVVFEFLIL